MINKPNKIFPKTWELENRSKRMHHLSLLRYDGKLFQTFPEVGASGQYNNNNNEADPQRKRGALIDAQFVRDYMKRRQIMAQKPLKTFYYYKI